MRYSWVSAVRRACLLPSTKRYSKIHYDMSGFAEVGVWYDIVFVDVKNSKTHDMKTDHAVDMG